MWSLVKFKRINNTSSFVIKFVDRTAPRQNRKTLNFTKVNVEMFHKNTKEIFCFRYLNLSVYATINDA